MSSSIETSHGVGGIGFRVEGEKFTEKAHHAFLLPAFTGMANVVNARATTESMVPIIVSTLIVVDSIADALPQQPFAFS